MNKITVISLGGSLIVPVKKDGDFLIRFVKTLQKNAGKNKFIIVCGGGAIARRYISELEAEGKNKTELTKAGVRATRMNAQFMMQMFGKEANEILPKDMNDVKNAIPKNKIVVCGALRNEKNATSDSTAARLAAHFKTDFVNITNVDGLYTSDPKKNSNAKLVKDISWQDFEKLASKIKFHAGQNFVLDQKSAGTIKKKKVKTFIIGPNTQNLKNLLEGKKFKGTTISE